MKKPKNQLKKSQVRIIGGTHKRRPIDFYAIKGLRPTPDRLRETLFNWLMGDLLGATVLDVCAGSGVLGFEAISRGAKMAILLELDKTQVAQLRQNATVLNLDTVSVIQGDCLQILPTLAEAFDIVFIDPPYHSCLWQQLVALLLDCHLLKSSALIYIEGDRPLEQMIDESLIRQFITIKSARAGQIWAYVLTKS